MRRVGVVALALAAVAGGARMPVSATGAPVVRTDSLRVIAGGRDTALSIVAMHGARMIEAAPLVRVLGGTLETTDRLRYRIRLPGFSAEVMPGTPFVRVGDGTWPLGTAPALRDDDLFLPLQFAVEFLPRLAQNVEYHAARSELRGTRVAAASAPAPVRRQRVIVVDAGHGGTDPGMCAILPSGQVVWEKSITLGVAQKLAIALKDKGHAVVMTRQRDTLIALADRGAIANRARGDLFVSIHVNSASTKECRPAAGRGFETYFLSESRTEDERRVAAMENEAVRYETGPSAAARDGLSFLLNDMAQNEHLRESSDLAETVQRHLTSRGHPGPDRGVKQAPFVVLVHAFMPAVLIETGFGSSQAEARWLASGEGQSLLANAIANAVDEYWRNFDRRVGNDAK